VAATYYGQAIALAGEMGMGPLIAHCHLGLGELHRRRDDRGRAQERFAKAMAMYPEMDMVLAAAGRG
jgi:hypothetical protein